MKEIKFTFRDLLAIPIWWLAQSLDKLAISIGGTWTAKIYLDGYKNMSELFNKHIKID